MRKTICCVMAILASLILLSSCSGQHSAVKKNAKILFQEMRVGREQAIKQYPKSVMLRNCYITKEAMVDNAKTLASLGMEEIVEIEIQFGEDDDGGFFEYEIYVTDKMNKKYCISTSEGGWATFIYENDENGTMLWWDY